LAPAGIDGLMLPQLLRLAAPPALTCAMVVPEAALADEEARRAICACALHAATNASNANRRTPLFTS
jgi:hypothetical protein